MKEEYDVLLESEVYKNWKKENPSFELAHCFLMTNKQVQAQWQFGFYSADADHIVTFVIKDDEVVCNPASEAFKDPDKKIQPLQLTDELISFDQAQDIGMAKTNELAKSQPITTTINILQQLSDFGTVWNITFVTAAFTTVNVKVDAITGEVKYTHVDSLVNLAAQRLPGEKE